MQGSPNVSPGEARGRVRRVFTTASQRSSTLTTSSPAKALPAGGAASCLASVGQDALLAPPSPAPQPWEGPKCALCPLCGVGGWVSLSASPLHSRQWLEDALRENEAGSCFVFLVGTKKDLLVSRVALEVWVAPGKIPPLSALIEKPWGEREVAQWEAGSCLSPRASLQASPGCWVNEGYFSQSGAACQQAEAKAVHLAKEMQAEYWSVSAKTGENVKAFFSRVAALAFEQSVLQDLERRSSTRLQVGDGDLIRMEGSPPETQESKKPSGLGCC
ncbi:Ras- protein Rab-36 [Saguinus oedipus]|uniref:Ras- protein Rab-36 n=1 Tax=Saguinus oedipus TaxID=9490 RepID=A0ABQ9WHR8_SAGOE|nr:Ras- protein Rab-36 [Saguinus oedipus]